MQRELGFVLLSETVANGEEIPAALLIELPDECLLTGELGLVLVDQMHQEEEIIGQIVLLHCVRFEPVWHLIKILFTQRTDETL